MVHTLYVISTTVKTYEAYRTLSSDISECIGVNFPRAVGAPALRIRRHSSGDLNICILPSTAAPETRSQADVELEELGHPQFRKKSTPIPIGVWAQILEIGLHHVEQR